ncbi:MAG: tetratricopeptide repeat protein [Myxococcales bacterium]|nr:tetratricopeptide repeat protein [Myxococcales bacterium]
MKRLQAGTSASRAVPSGAALLLLVAASSCCLPGCDEKQQPSPPAAASTPTSPVSASAMVPAAASFDPLRPYTGKPTPGDIAVGNLASQITAQEKLLAKREDLGLRAALVDRYLSRTQFLGTYADFDQAEKQVELALEKHPKDPKALLLKASVDGALHRFDDALKTLDEAEKVGAKPDVIRKQKQTIWLARGEHLDEVVKERKAVADEYPTYASLTALASAQMAAGEFEAADKSFVEAVRKYRDVSPFAVAWVSFQRGVMWAEHAGQSEKAVPLYREAVALLPQYVVANVHLAELEREAGKTDEAKRRLLSVLRPGADPEPASVLAELLEEDEPEQAAKYAAQAKQGYESLLKRYPLAFADHASEFYLGPGKDPKRAQALAEQNLKNRATERAFMLAIGASMLNRDLKRACELASDARLAQPKNPDVAKIRDRAKKTCE